MAQTPRERGIPMQFRNHPTEIHSPHPLCHPSRERRWRDRHRRVASSLLTRRDCKPHVAPRTSHFRLFYHFLCNLTCGVIYETGHFLGSPHRIYGHRIEGALQARANLASCYLIPSRTVGREGVRTAQHFGKARCAIEACIHRVRRFIRMNGWTLSLPLPPTLPVTMKAAGRQSSILTDKFFEIGCLIDKLASRYGKIFNVVIRSYASVVQLVLEIRNLLSSEREWQRQRCCGNFFFSSVVILERWCCCGWTSHCLGEERTVIPHRVRCT